MICSRMRTARIVLIERLRTHAADGRRTLRLFVRPGSRRGAWIWFDPAEAPDFEGAAAWFEIERCPTGWRIVRMVGPAGSAGDGGSP